ncbi:ABC transporter ATP-binding protein [Planctomicrobium piriforme]|uniref:Molybdate/tungstate transport system ATP-binding protein n=1 Tax=Planctomicrobium piriforme TaxID=1576369 RepID=A0A1I3C5J8_9PLAN|nr:ABC transporter ATP-binding protein [Planctomicrobium piriforme]SFH69770.1 molybdate/tungstate transport system ATP-binding protein [Planctomicrobium piriforme]
MIELRDISLRLGAFEISGLNWSVPTGAYSVLMGQTGAGKTTLLEIICGLRRPATGSVLIHDRDVTQSAPGERQVGYVPQDLALFPTMTVRQHLEFALRLRRWTKERQIQRVNELAEWLKIGPLLERNVLNLSGGEAQRVALGRAISFYPEVVLLDEPLSALDEASRARLQTLLKELQRKTQTTFLHVTHSGDEARALADRIFVMENGRVRDEA